MQLRWALLYDLPASTSLEAGAAILVPPCLAPAFSFFEIVVLLCSPDCPQNLTISAPAAQGMGFKEYNTMSGYDTAFYNGNFPLQSNSHKHGESKYISF